MTKYNNLKELFDFWNIATLNDFKNAILDVINRQIKKIIKDTKVIGIPCSLPKLYKLKGSYNALTNLLGDLIEKS